MMAVMDEMDTERKNYRWVMKRYHKRNPIFIYRKWRTRKVARQLEEMIDRKFK